ncbi:MAG: TolC family protein [Campylobacterota bacterium]|nr:TolC family protein [Campylobacterota bacterium]
MKSSILKLSLFALFACGYSLSAQVLTPADAYQKALENSHEIKSSFYQYKSKEEGVNQVKARLYPQINAALSHSVTDYEINHLQTISNRDVTETSTDYKLTLKQSLYNHETYTKIDLEKGRLKLSKLQLDYQKQQLAQDLFKVYMEVLNSKNRIELLESYVNYNDYKLQAVEKRFNMNLSNKMDLLQSKVEYSRSKIDLVKEKKLYAINMLRLKQYIASDDIVMPIVKFDAVNDTLINQIQNIVKNSKLDDNLELQQAKAALRMSELEIINTQSLHYPVLNLNASYTKFDSDDFTTDYEDTQKVMLELSVPLYQGGSVSSRVKSSKFIKKAAFEDIELTKKDLKVKYDELQTVLSSTLESVLVYKEAVDSSKAYLDSIQKGHNSGLKSIIDVFDAKNKLYEVKLEYMKNISEMLSRYIDFLVITNNISQIELVDRVLLSK